MTLKNVTARIGEDFNKELEDIIKKRIEIGKDKKKKSKRRLTNLIVKHRDWNTIKNDTIEVNLEDEK